MSLDARFQTMANKAHEAVATHGIHKHMQMNRPSLRTCDWTQNLKPLPTTPARHLGQRLTQSRLQSSAPQNPKNIACDADLRDANVHLASLKLQQSHHLLHMESR